MLEDLNVLGGEAERKQYELEAEYKLKLGEMKLNKAQRKEVVKEIARRNHRDTYGTECWIANFCLSCAFFYPQRRFLYF